MKKGKETNKTSTTAFLSIFIVFFDIVIFFVCWLFLANNSFFVSNRYISYASIFVTYIIVFLILNRVYDGYAFGRKRIAENAYSLSLSSFISIFCFYFLDTLAFRIFFSPFYAVVGFAANVLINIIYCKKANDIYFKNYVPKKTLIIYKEKYDLMKIKDIPFFDKKYSLRKKIENPQSFKSIKDELACYEAIFISGIKASLRNGIVKECVNNNTEAYVIPHVGDVIMAGGEYVNELPVPMIRIERGSTDLFYVFFKRTFDIVVAGVAAIIFSPFMAITALAIKLYDGGPALYKQVRLTKDRKEFTIYKFRSMKVDAEKDGVARLVSKKDNRITPIGKIIRAIRFDELPQIFNILKGDMSIVGPRPERPEIIQQYENIYPSFSLRLQVKAGLTGYAQIYGRYNTEPIDKLKMDLYYVNKMSFLYDVQLCFMTVKTLFMRESTEAIEEGSVTASKSRDEE